MLSAISMRRPVPPERPVFPKDEGAHPGVKTEWWYLNGHLQDADGHRYGFMDCLFDVPDVIDARYNKQWPDMPGAMQLDMSLVDVDKGKHYTSRELKLRDPGELHEGIQSGGLDESLASHHGQWRIVRTGANTLHLEAPLKAGKLSLDLEQVKPPLMMGGEGEIQMGPQGLSKYYSLPQLKASGTLTLPHQAPKKVEGTAWLDHQWGDMSMFRGWSGWDWFGIQLEDGTQMNVFRFRDEQGQSVQSTIGISRPDGTQDNATDLKLTPLDSWQSDDTDAKYPIAWRLEIPSRQIDLEVRPSVRDQEMVGTPPYIDPSLSVLPTYWEGDTTVKGTIAGQPVQGRAYEELLGYTPPDDVDAAEEAAARAKQQTGRGLAG
jgi:predicted secreted hydrolase